MAKQFSSEILVVDDDEAVRECFVLLLDRSGYTVKSAVDGLDALAQLATSTPAVLISDLNLPNMSGFELLSIVRRRFPHMAAIAMSGAYSEQDAVLDFIAADAFYDKGLSGPDVLLRAVSDCAEGPAARSLQQTRKSVPIWVPRSGNDVHGTPYVVVNCPGCLRSFPAHAQTEKAAETPVVHQCECLFCPTPIRYIVDISIAMAVARTEKAQPIDAGFATLPRRQEIMRHRIVPGPKL